MRDFIIMKFLRIASLLLFASACLAHEETYLYRQELEAFKNNPEYRIIFDEDANPLLKSINRNVENCKELSILQRFVRSAFLALGAVVVTPQTMPKLYAYVDDMCKQHNLPTPTVFINTDRGFFNAAAQKLLISTGGIIIGQKLMNESSDAMLEGVVAHEIGHIKHNHINKMLGLLCVSILTAEIACNYFKIKDNLTSAILGIAAAKIIINKRFEKEADAFAYEQMGKGKGLKQIFQLFESKAQSADNDVTKTGANLNQNYSKIGLIDFITLKCVFVVAQLQHGMEKIHKWFYYNTPFGPHPSPQERIRTIQNYLDTQAQQA